MHVITFSRRSFFTYIRPPQGAIQWSIVLRDVEGMLSNETRPHSVMSLSINELCDELRIVAAG